MLSEPEPFEIASMREHSYVDYAAILLLGLCALAWAVAPPVRLLVLTAVRVCIAALLITTSWAATGFLSTAMAWAGHAFLFLALFSVAAHVEAAVLAPLVDRIVGTDR